MTSGSRIPQTSEGDLLKCVLSLAKLYGWRTLHIRAARTADGYTTPLQGDGVGWPDLLMVRNRRMIAAELKSEKGHTTHEQEIWLHELGLAGAEVWCWRPSHWADGSILRTLSGTKKENL